MSTAKSFKSILRDFQKPQQQVQRETFTHFADPRLLTFTWVNTPIQRPTPSAKSSVRSYKMWMKSHTRGKTGEPAKAKVEAKPSIEPTSAHREEPCVTLSQLSLKAQQAFTELLQMGSCQLDAKRLNIYLLKKEYRKLAKELHPDWHPQMDSRAFSALHEHYRLLFKEIRSLLDSPVC